MKALSVHRGTAGEDLVGRILCHEIRGHEDEIVFRKGRTLLPEDIAPLMGAVWTEVHLLELEGADLGQREAGLRIAQSLSDPDLEVVPAGHRHLLRARSNGLLEIDVEALRELNSVPGVAVFTLPDGRVVQSGQVVAEAQITPLAIEERVLKRAERIGTGAAAVRLLPFIARDVVIFARDDRMIQTLTSKLRWYGCSVAEVVDLPRDPVSIRQAMERRSSSAATLFLVTGSNALDPLDPVFKALEQLGATMHTLGLPVHPGTLLWIASWRGIHVIGLPSCGHGTQRTGFDLVLARLLAHGQVTEDEIAAMGHGGILSESMGWKP